MLGGALLAELNYSLFFWVILCNILEMADVETPNNHATSANDIPNFFINRSAISERTRGISPSRLPIRSSSRDIFPLGRLPSLRA
jgi:hypothetical protein